MLKIIFWFFAFALFLLVVEFGWFWFVLQKTPESEPADAVVVFGGDHARTVKGYGLANEGLAPFLIISPASHKRVERLDRTCRLRDSYQYLIEDRAETTFQNAALVADLVQKHELKSVLLVTGNYHMPRSLLLLKMQLMGTKVKVSACPVAVARFGGNPFGWTTSQKKRIYNEMVELWGSLFETGHFAVTGRLPAKGVKENRVVAWLRSVVLFKV